MIWYVQKALGDCNETILSASSYWNIFVTDTCFVLLLRLAALACRPHCHIPVRLENGKIIYIEDWGRGFFGSAAQTLTPLATPRKPNISDSPKNQASRRKWRKGWVLVVFDWTLIEHEFSWIFLRKRIRPEGVSRLSCSPFWRKATYSTLQAPTPLFRLWWFSNRHDEWLHPARTETADLRCCRDRKEWPYCVLGRGASTAFVRQIVGSHVKDGWML